MYTTDHFRSVRYVISCIRYFGSLVSLCQLILILILSCNFIVQLSCYRRLSILSVSYRTGALYSVFSVYRFRIGNKWNVVNFSIFYHIFPDFLTLKEICEYWSNSDAVKDSHIDIDIGESYIDPPLVVSKRERVINELVDWQTDALTLCIRCITLH